jgi:curved DNA-binding protein CbpA
MESKDQSDQPPVAQSEIETHNQTDLYQVLGLKQNATQDEIKNKYKELLLVYHPDKGGDPQKFKDLKIAYKILSDPVKRKTYTSALANTHFDLTHGYNEEVDKGYGQNENDFNKAGLSESQKDEKRKQFMQDFENHRSSDERHLMDSMKATEAESERPLTLEEMIRHRDLESELIPQVMNPQDFNINVFNQMFNQVKQRSQTGLERIIEPDAVNQSGSRGLEPASPDGHGIFSHDQLSAQNFNEYVTPVGLEWSQFDPNKEVTRTRDLDDVDLTTQLEQRMKLTMADRDALLNIGDEDHPSYSVDYSYSIKPEHNPDQNPLSLQNMLGQDLMEGVKGSIAPPRVSTSQAL